MPNCRRGFQLIQALTLSLATWAWAPVPLRAAEEVVLDFGPLSRSIPVSSLVTFAETGQADAQLAPFLMRFNPDQQAQLRTALTAERETNLTRISQWFYDPMGEHTLLFLGQVAQTAARLNGQQALRSAIIAATAEDGQLSLLDVIRHFPTSSLRFDVAQILNRREQIVAEGRTTRALVEIVRQASAAQAAQAPVLDLATLPDLTQPGPYGSRQISLVLEDRTRDRTYPAEVFVPQNLADLDTPIPVIVISHGLGDRPASFFDIAAHAASHGFVVALPEHIGSNSTQKQAMLNGLDSESFKAQEFLDRPLDLSFLLDELDRLNSTTFGGQLQVDRVVAVGHSFGGYGVLAWGGATIDFDRLAQRCNPTANIVIDAALVLECRALELRAYPEIIQRLGEDGVKDDRVKLVMAFAPVSNLFGPTGMGRLSLPVMMFGGAFDIVAPVVPQQLSAFNWLTTPDRHLYLAENTSHGTDFTRVTSDFLNLDQYFEQSIDEALVLTRAVNKSLIVAFSQVYGANRPEFQPFLSAAYVEAISTDPFRLHRVSTLPPEAQDWLPE
jgi:predicted dienelactone hydrolase